MKRCNCCGNKEVEGCRCDNCGRKVCYNGVVR